jgi:DNA gyrase subunit A
MGRPAAGVNAIRLQLTDRVAGMDVIKAEDTHVLVVTANGYGKQTSVDEYAQRGRYGMGVRTISNDERTGPVVAMRLVNPKDDIVLISRSGIVLRTRLDEIRRTGRNALGVRLMKLPPGDTVCAIAIMSPEDAAGLTLAQVTSAMHNGSDASPTNGHQFEPLDLAGDDDMSSMGDSDTDTDDGSQLSDDDAGGDDDI